MTITINPFIAGIVVTLFSEFVAFTVWAIVYAFKYRKNKEQ